MNDFPCACGHMATDHNKLFDDDESSDGCESCGFGGATKEVCDECDCKNFEEMNNFQYVEWIEKGRQGGLNERE